VANLEKHGLLLRLIFAIKSGAFGNQSKTLGRTPRLDYGLDSPDCDRTINNLKHRLITRIKKNRKGWRIGREIC
jgi:hypothetical protein